MKRCTDCDRVKPSEEFGLNRQRPDGLSFYCRECNRRRAMEHYRRRRRASGHQLRHDRGPAPEGHRFCSGCQRFLPISDWFANRGSKTGLSSYCKACMRAKGAESYLKRRYGLSTSERQQVYASQGGLCVICRDAPAAHVDHDHNTGHVRGLLCFNCHAGLGQFKDSTDLLAATADYLNVRRGIVAKRRPRNPSRVIELFRYRGPDVEVEVRPHRRSA